MNISPPQRPNAEYPGNSKNSGLSVDWVVGFVDAQGCFHIVLNKNSEMKLGWQILPEFLIVQHKRDINLIYKLRTFFGCGVVRKHSDDRYCLRIRKLDNLVNVIIPFFEEHPLKSKKNIEFKKFAYIVKLMMTNRHLTVEGFNEIVKIVKEMEKESCQDKDRVHSL